MTIKEIYNLAIKLGKEADPRSQNRLKKLLDIEVSRFQTLSKEEKEFYDRESLTNPYADSRIYAKDSAKKIKTILAGIDIGSAEIMLADILREKGKLIDLVISHHPLGSAFASLDNVMHLQTDLISDLGVPVNIAENILEKRIAEVNRKIISLNHYQALDTAKLLNIPIICIHTPADNMVYNFLNNLINKHQPELVSDIIKILHLIPEYRLASHQGVGPKIFAGKPYRRTGKIVLTEITGGTNGAKEMYEYLSRAGVGTIISMYMPEEHRLEAEKHHLNVVIAGHMASDSLGMNLILDKLSAKKINIIPYSGLIRVNRNK